MFVKQTCFILKNITHLFLIFLGFLEILQTPTKAQYVHTIPRFFNYCRHPSSTQTAWHYHRLHNSSASSPGSWHSGCLYQVLSVSKLDPLYLVIYAYFKSILKPFKNENKATRFIQKHKICAALALLVSKNEDVFSR